MPTASTSVRAPADSPKLRPSSQPIAIISAKDFLARVNRRVDEMEADRLRHQADGGFDVVEYLKLQHPVPVVKPVSCETLPARFKRELDIFLGNLRFGRTRLFLSRFIGDLAWRGVSL